LKQAPERPSACTPHVQRWPADDPAGCLRQQPNSSCSSPPLQQWPLISSAEPAGQATVMVSGSGGDGGGALPQLAVERALGLQVTSPTAGAASLGQSVSFTTRPVVLLLHCSCLRAWWQLRGAVVAAQRHERRGPRPCGSLQGVAVAVAAGAVWASWQPSQGVSCSPWAIFRQAECMWSRACMQTGQGREAATDRHQTAPPDHKSPHSAGWRPPAGSRVMQAASLGRGAARTPAHPPPAPPLRPNPIQAPAHLFATCAPQGLPGIAGRQSDCWPILQ
jgi:hypothetical protein